MGANPVKFALDTSCLIALLLDWHELHSPTLAEYEARRHRGEIAIIPAHALLEAFSVMTRLPAAKRISPPDARDLLAGSFSTTAEVPDLPAAFCWETIEELAAQGTGGGLVYDATIALAAHRAGASVLLSWDRKDMLRVAPPGLAVRSPDQPQVW